MKLPLRLRLASWALLPLAANANGNANANDNIAGSAAARGLLEELLNEVPLRFHRRTRHTLEGSSPKEEEIEATMPSVFYYEDRQDLTTEDGTVSGSFYRQVGAGAASGPQLLRYVERTHRRPGYCSLRQSSPSPAGLVEKLSLIPLINKSLVVTEWKSLVDHNGEMVAKWSL